MSKRVSPLISFIVAVYNGKAMLQQCIDSVAGQTFPHKDQVIKDGGSGIGTVGLIRANRDRIGNWVPGPDHGLPVRDVEAISFRSEMQTECPENFSFEIFFKWFTCSCVNGWNFRCVNPDSTFLQNTSRLLLVGT